MICRIVSLTEFLFFGRNTHSSFYGLRVRNEAFGWTNQRTEVRGLKGGKLRSADENSMIDRSFMQISMC